MNWLKLPKGFLINLDNISAFGIVVQDNPSNIVFYDSGVGGYTAKFNSPEQAQKYKARLEEYLQAHEFVSLDLDSNA